MNDMPIPAPAHGLLTYDQFEPGRTLGTMELTVDAEMLGQWQAVYGDLPEGATLPLAFAPLLVMRAMLAIAAPRPPGNLHVGQSYRIERMPRAGACISASVSCARKEIHKGRRIVELEIALADGSGEPPIVTGNSTIFWAR